MIPFMNDTQSVEGQPWFDVLDVLGVGCDESGQSTRRDDGRLAELFKDPFDDPVDLSGEAVQDPDWIDSTIDLPMTERGRTSSTERSAAACA